MKTREKEVILSIEKGIVLGMIGDLFELRCVHCSHHRNGDGLPPLQAAAAALPALPGLPAPGRGALRRSPAAPGHPAPGKSTAGGFDLVFSIGTTSVFPYIAQPFTAARHFGALAVEINPGDTEVSRHANVRWRCGAAAALERLWQSVSIAVIRPGPPRPSEALPAPARKLIAPPKDPASPAVIGEWGRFARFDWPVWRIMSTRTRELIRLNLLLAAGYATLGVLALRIAIAPGVTAPIFPSAGLALAALLIYGRPALPGIYLGALLVQLSVAFGGRYRPAPAAQSSAFPPAFVCRPCSACGWRNAWRPIPRRWTKPAAWPC